MKKISYFLMGYKGYSVLKGIIDSNKTHLISKIITSKDRNIENDYYEEIWELATRNNLKIFDKNEDIFINSDYAVAISWRWLITDIKSKLIIFHDSLLPKYRGFSPLVNMLIKNEPQIGVTVFWATEEFDRGPMIFQKSIQMAYPIKIWEAIKIVSKIYDDLNIQLLQFIESNAKLPMVPQDEKKATYSIWRDEEDYLIDWNKSSMEILNFINAVSYPYKGASSFIKNRKVRILDAEIVEDLVLEIRDPGKVIFLKDGYPYVICGKGILKIKEMIDDLSGQSLIPFTKFRVRFIGKK